MNRWRCQQECSRWCAPTKASGVMFTMDTESGFTDAVFITSSYGLGEAVVQGAVNPDEFYVYKPALLAGRPAILKRGIGGKATKMIYSGPDGRKDNGVRGRPSGGPAGAQLDRHRCGGACAAGRGDREPLRAADGHRVGQGWCRRPVVHSAGSAGDGAVPAGCWERAAFPDGPEGPVLVEGRAIGQRIGAGPVVSFSRWMP